MSTTGYAYAPPNFPSGSHSCKKGERHLPTKKRSPLNLPSSKRSLFTNPNLLP
ncbi:hypothetical protein [aff. Roholtiella sp. LEGE 12411]|uniref:hypothetical protein n=1 Tax=aff. Roholtiella sp. LEGE 12411 TaxID=1828822 RepID=UPI0018817A88|nr:hypothetical protein [aff. Roholtiella sp. LEGE 12411]MBE9038519.1 hypothetical protein [aff. Roholtiella sp. LEGE 12411]